MIQNSNHKLNNSHNNTKIQDNMINHNDLVTSKNEGMTEIEIMNIHHTISIKQNNTFQKECKINLKKTNMMIMINHSISKRVDKMKVIMIIIENTKVSYLIVLKINLKTFQLMTNNQKMINRHIKIHLMIAKRESPFNSLISMKTKKKTTMTTKRGTNHIEVHRTEVNITEMNMK